MEILNRSIPMHLECLWACHLLRIIADVRLISGSTPAPNARRAKAILADTGLLCLDIVWLTTVTMSEMAG